MLTFARLSIARSLAAGIGVAALGCQPKPSESTPAAPVEAPTHAIASPEIETETETEAANDVDHRPSTPLPEAERPRPPSHPTLGLGTLPRRSVPDRTSITTEAIDPGEFRSMVNRVHDDERPALHERCVLAHHPDRATISGQLTLDYDIGTVARVVTATVDSCDYPEPEICTCIRDRVLKWRFVPHVQNVEVSIRVQSHPSEP